MSDLAIATQNIGDITQQGLGNSRYVFSIGYNDLQIGSNRDFALISNLTKLQQDILKIIITDRYTNTVYPAYGSIIRAQIGTKNIEQAKANIKNAVIEALTVLQIINTNNPSLDEQINTIDTITVDVTNPTEVSIKIQITTKSGKVLNSSAVLGG